MVDSVRPVSYEGLLEGPPSQSEADALRDGVSPELAAVPVAWRVTWDPPKWLPPGQSARHRTDEGRWVASRPSGDLSQRIGRHVVVDPYRTSGRDVISLNEYGEVLLMNAEGTRIQRAFPLPGVPIRQIF